jgi:hypothetical protein
MPFSSQPVFRVDSLSEKCRFLAMKIIGVVIPVCACSDVRERTLSNPRIEIRLPAGCRIELGFDVKTAQTLAWHKDLLLTMNVYGRANAERKRPMPAPTVRVFKYEIPWLWRQDVVWT